MRWLHRMRWLAAIERFLDDELPAGRAELVLGHLEDCPECLAELELLARVQSSLVRLGPR